MIRLLLQRQQKRGIRGCCFFPLNRSYDTRNTHYEGKKKYKALAQNENGGRGGLGCYTQTVSACWSAGGFSPGDQHVCIFNNVDAAPYKCGEISCYGNASYRTCVGGNSPYN